MIFSVQHLDGRTKGGTDGTAHSSMLPRFQFLLTAILSLIINSYSTPSKARVDGQNR